jgi:hypothetical protein
MAQPDPNRAGKLRLSPQDRVSKSWRRTQFARQRIVASSASQSPAGGA